MLQAFSISNTELGTYFSVYGIVAMISYFFGGPLADRYPARNLMSIALVLTGLGGLLMSMIPSGGVMILLYGFWGATTILLFWSALIKATREWGGDNFQGRAFGWLEAGRGTIAALLGTFSVLVFSGSNNNEFANPGSVDVVDRFQSVVLFTAFVTIGVGLLVWRLVPASNSSQSTETIKWKQLKFVLQIPSLWWVSLIIICAYTGYKITDDFSLYANEVLGYNETNSAGLASLALWMRGIVAFISGYLADKFKGSRIIVYGFGLTALGGVGLATGWFESALFLLIINLLFVMIGIYGVRALYFTLVEEAKIPIYYTGTAVGIVSVLGFTPEVFMSPWMGYILDHNPGAEGHRLVFLVLVGFAIIGVMGTLRFRVVSRLLKGE